MSPDGHCRAFDERAAGTVNGSGVGVVVLKRLADALADGDAIRAVILGSAVNNDGSAKVGFTAPSVEGQSEVIAEALLMAGVEPETIGFVEAHGSGTPIGDPIEVAALTQAFRGATGRSGFCALGSVKTNLGHCNTAAGIAGLLKAVLALEHREIPPSLWFERPNPQIDFAASPFFVSSRLTPWEETGEAPRRAGVSSFGLGGTNAHAVLEEAPPREPSAPPSRAAQLLVISARTPTALDAATANLVEHLRGLPEDDAAGLADVAWTLQTGRRAFEHRRIAVARSAGEAAAALTDPLRSVSGRRAGEGERPVVFLFPGLGDQYPGMARGLYASEPLFREIVDDCAERLRPELGVDLRELVFAERDPSLARGGEDLLRTMLRRNAEDPAAARLAETAVAHPAAFVIEYALARLLMSWGIRPEAMIGYSLGEYVAACLAGVLTLEDALRVVAQRAQLIQELPGGAMLAVPLSESEVRPLLAGREDRLSVAATNGPHFCVIGGSREALEELEGELAGRGASCIFLQTTHAFHSAMMEPAMARFGEALSGVRLGTPQIPYLSNVTGTWITAEDLADPLYWARHMRGTVRFAEGLAELLAGPGRVYLEVGPGATLGTLVKQHEAAPAGAVTVATLRRAGEERDDVDVLLEAAGRLWLAGAAVGWSDLHGGERRLRVPLPTYPFERTRCWIDPPADSPLRAEPGASAAAQREDVTDWFWVPAWRQAPPAGLSPVSPEPGSWLIFVDPDGLGERIAGRLRRDGQEVMTVAGGEGFGVREDYESLIRQLRGREQGLPTHILHLWGATAGEPSYDEAQRAGLLSLMFLEQALINTASGAEGPAIRIGVVTTGAHEVADGDRVIPARAMVLGACKVIHQESRQLTCVSIDVALPPAGSPGEERLIGQLLAEMDVPEAELEPVVAYRGRQRWVRTFEAVRVPPITGETGLSRLRPDGAYLITDGAHAIGLGMAEALAGLGARVAVLLPPELPAPERLLPLEERGVIALRADIADVESLAGALMEARSRCGGLDGVLHTAAPFTGGLIQLKTPEGLEEALRPVARGAEALLTALERTGIAPDFVLLTGSTLAFSGGLGQLDIAAAGCYLDALAQRRIEGAEGGPYTVVVHWDPYQWDGWLAAGTAAVSGLQPGQLEQELASFGTHPEQSAEALRRLLATPLQRAVVAARDLRALIAETDAFTIEAFMAQMQKANSDQARGRADLATPYVEPASDLERQVAAIWEELFGIRPIGLDDNFLELGGHSLLAIQVTTQLRNAFGIDLPVNVLFEAPTVGALAAAVAREQGGGDDPDELERLLELVEGLSPEEALQKMEELGVSPEEVLH